jgi:LPPG:FO 2-phospho-L-lactate transferase
MARALSAVLKPSNLTVVVNVGDDDEMYGLHVSPDLDTVLYTMAGVEGIHGWGRHDDTFEVMSGLGPFGVDTSFRLGDQDLALCLLRTTMLGSGKRLSEFTKLAADRFEVRPRILPVTDDPLRTKIKTTGGEWLDFQEYFVARRHEDRVAELRFAGAEQSTPAPGVLDAIAGADLIVVAPSNPPLSIWPLLAVPGVRRAVSAKPVVAAVSPLFGGRALKGPAASVLSDLGLPGGTAGVLESYDGLLSHLFVDVDDATNVDSFESSPVQLHAADTRIEKPESGARFAAELLDILEPALRPASVR